MFWKFLMVSVFFFTVPFFVSPVFAAPIIVANLSIHRATVTSQQGNTVTVAFDFDNGQGTQSQIKYGISIMEAVVGENGVPGGFISVDEKVYDEILSFSPNSKTHREITYEAHQSLTGTYALFVNAKNSDGLPLSTAFAANIVFPGNGSIDTVDIIPKTCFMTISGEEGQPHYTLTQGPDISFEENLIAQCDVVNNSDKVVEITPVYETYYRTIYGEKVPHKGDLVIPITLQPREKRNVSLALPKATEPQAYDVKVSFVGGALPSNTMTFHYVLRGASATIQSFAFDKDNYIQGDVAKLLFLWSPSADGFDASRANKKTDISEVRLSIEITNVDGNECSAPIEQVLDQSILIPRVEISVPITKDCKNPKASVAIKDAQGNSVAKGRDFLVESKTQVAAKTEEKQQPFSFLFTVVVIFIGFIGFVTYVFIKVKKNKHETSID